MMSSTTQALSPSPQQRRPPRARDVVHLVPFPSPYCRRPVPSPSPQHHRPPWAHDAIVLPNAVVLPKRARQHCNFFVTLGLQILILICYIVTLLWYGTLFLFCYITLMWYIATLLWFATLPLTCHIALICYIATLLWYAALLLICYIATLIWCYIAFVLLHCFYMLHCHIALICYTLLYCFCSTTFWSIWMHTTLLNNEGELREMSVAIWTNIFVLLRFHLRTTCSN
jgi:hypothetical protein